MEPNDETTAWVAGDGAPIPMPTDDWPPQGVGRLRAAREGLSATYATRVPSVTQVRISIQQVVTASAPAARHAASRAQSATQSGVAATKPYAKHIALALAGVLVLVLLSLGGRHRSHTAGD
jgi:hypothetical protein